MNRQQYLEVMAVLVAMCASACSGLSFSINTPVFVDDRTALENQVIGDYEPLEEDLLLITSLPGGVGGADANGVVPAASSDPRVAEAQARLVRILQVQQFNREDLLRHLQQGWVGERSDGYLHLFTDRVAAESARSREQLERFVAETNRDRSDLIGALIVISPALSESDRPETERIYARRQISRLSAGMWHETAQEGWTQIGAGETRKADNPTAR